MGTVKHMEIYCAQNVQRSFPGFCERDASVMLVLFGG